MNRRRRGERIRGGGVVSRSCECARGGRVAFVCATVTTAMSTRARRVRNGGAGAAAVGSMESGDGAAHAQNVVSPLRCLLTRCYGYPYALHPESHPARLPLSFVVDCGDTINVRRGAKPVVGRQRLNGGDPTSSHRPQHSTRTHARRAHGVSSLRPPQHR